jgi:Uma2 family endonuclease
LSRQAKKFVTPDEYLALERQAEYKNEYFDGEVFAMVGASRKHNLISLNVASELRAQLRGHECEVYQSDMRVRIPSANVYTYPDAVVVCGEPRFEDAAADTLLNPTVIVEVLSKSTETYDRGAKFSYYRTLESVAEYLLIAQDEFHVEHYVRQADGRWMLADIRAPESSVGLDSIRRSLPLRDVYEKVEME